MSNTILLLKISRSLHISIKDLERMEVIHEDNESKEDEFDMS
jgi:hypothetical protein